MTRRQLTPNISIDFGYNNPEWARIRKSVGMQNELAQIGAETVRRCNEELHAAQAARKEPQADGYEATVVADQGDRARLFINPTTARAMAHEAVNHAILKNLPIGQAPPAPDHTVPRELGELGAAARQRNAVFLSHVRAFTP